MILKAWLPGLAWSGLAWPGCLGVLLRHPTVEVCVVVLVQWCEGRSGVVLAGVYVCEHGQCHVGWAGSVGWQGRACGGSAAVSCAVLANLPAYPDREHARQRW